MAASSVFTQSTWPFRAAIWTGSMPLVPRLVKHNDTQGSYASIPGSIHNSIHTCVLNFWIHILSGQSGFYFQNNYKYARVKFDVFINFSFGGWGCCSLKYITNIWDCFKLERERGRE